MEFSGVLAIFIVKKTWQGRPLLITKYLFFARRGPWIPTAFNRSKFKWDKETPPREEGWRWTEKTEASEALCGDFF